MPFRLVDIYRRFEGILCLHFQVQAGLSIQFWNFVEVTRNSRVVFINISRDSNPKSCT